MFSPLVSRPLLGLLASALAGGSFFSLELWTQPRGWASVGRLESPPTRTGVTPRMSLGPPLLDSAGRRWSGVGLPIKTGYSLSSGIFPTVAFSAHSTLLSARKSVKNRASRAERNLKNHVTFEN